MVHSDSGWARSFTESDLSDTDNIVPFENMTPINLIIIIIITNMLTFIMRLLLQNKNIGDQPALHSFTLIFLFSLIGNWLITAVVIEEEDCTGTVM